MSADSDDRPDQTDAVEERPIRQDIPRGGPTEAQKKDLRAKLLAMHNQLARTGKDLANEALKKSGQCFKVDHMADAGSDNMEQDINLSLLEGESELLHEIETAIRKIDGQGEMPYGLCEACARQAEPWDEETGAPWIPVGRLQALPYARLCVFHQEEQEEG